MSKKTRLYVSKAMPLLLTAMLCFPLSDAVSRDFP